jgi:probable rRNA maturation factor
MQMPIARMASGGAEHQIGRKGRAEITVEGMGGARMRDWLKRQLRAVLRELGVSRAHWDVTVLGEADMCLLHERTLGIGTTTDVLTFDLRDELHGGEGAEVELDTVVCIDEARRRACEMGHGLREELLLYCVHSLLHVQGHDDRSPAGARRMHGREDEILGAIGAGPLYAGKRKLANTKRKGIGKGGR